MLLFLICFSHENLKQLNSNKKNPAIFTKNIKSLTVNKIKHPVLMERKSKLRNFITAQEKKVTFL